MEIRQRRTYKCPACSTSFDWKVGRDDDGLPLIRIVCFVEDHRILGTEVRYFHEAFRFMAEWHDDCNRTMREVNRTGVRTVLAIGVIER